MRSEGAPARRARRRRVALLTAGGIAAALLLTVVLLMGADEGASRLQLFIGRLHPLVVHLPIGFILLAAALEALGAVPGMRRVRHAVTPVLVLAVLGSLGAVAAGALLAGSGGYGGRVVELHRWLGISVAAGALLALGFRAAAPWVRARWVRAAYAVSLSATVATVVVAGHFGGTLTRGPDYLTEYMPAPILAVASLLPQERVDSTARFTYLEDALLYEHLVAPVLEARCVSCHGPDKQKGDLRLDSPEGISAGGTSGPVLTPGRAAESRLVQRVWLPPEHEEIMPPRGRSPLPAVEAELLRWWVDEGASFDAVLARRTPPPGVRAMLEQIAGPPEERVSPLLRTVVAPADSASVEAARALGLSVRPISAGSHFLRASCASLVDGCAREQLQALLPLAEQLAELDVGGSPVTDAEMEVVGRLLHLTRLDLTRTAIGDAGVEGLRPLRHLEWLNLYATRVSDASVPTLESLPALRTLHLWETDVTPQGARRLEEALPRARVNAGHSTRATALAEQ